MRSAQPNRTENNGHAATQFEETFFENVLSNRAGQLRLAFDLVRRVRFLSLWRLGSGMQSSLL
ncbi:MAG: hypothetical protein ACJ8LL_12515, partial [Candidatus Udaeobacter sp.]